MYLISILASLIVPLIVTFAQHNPFTRYQWNNRLVLVFAESSSDSLAGEQLKQFTGEEVKLRDRDMLVFLIQDGSAREVLTDCVFFVDETELRDLYSVDQHKSEVLLIGKDGGGKLVRKSMVQANKLYELIDRMPMRRAERRRKAGGS